MTIEPEEIDHFSSRVPLNGNEQIMMKIESLKSENSKLTARLQKSESLRRDIENKLKHLAACKGANSGLEGMMNMEWTTALMVDDKQAGLLFNLSDNMDLLKPLDKHLVKIDHASRDGKEHPLVVVSKNPLEMVSYPINEQIGHYLREFNNLMLDNCNMIGHIVVSQKRAEVTPGFAGVNGNLIWFNTGESALVLNIQTGEDIKSILLKPGFGFCLGKRERWTRVFLSSLDFADDLFSDSELAPPRPHAIFFWLR